MVYFIGGGSRLKSAQVHTYRLGVIGVTSSGKSTLINALLGEELLPAIAKPSSNQLVTCHKGNERKAIIYFDKRPEKVFTGSSLTQKVIRQYGDETINAANREGVKQIEIIMPGFPFSPEMLLIDSPGLDAFGLESHEELTLSTLLPTVDFCIFLTTCKTNSDETMKNALDKIAQYGKPVIIVQNMIDTIKASSDGKKSRSDVAQDHITRIERIVAASKIRNKKVVEIVQVSAINGLRKTAGRYSKASNFDELIRAITFRFKEIRPEVEASRLGTIKAEIERISKEAIIDASRTANTEDIEFEYSGLPQKLSQAVTKGVKEVRKHLYRFEELEKRVARQRSFAEYDLATVKSETESITSAICKSMSDQNSEFKSIAAELNVDSRDIFANFSVSAPDLKIHRKTVNKPRWVPGKRLWYTLWLVKSDGHMEYDTVIEDDHEATRKAAQERLSALRQSYISVLGKWQESLSRIQERLTDEIGNRRKAYELRRTEVLDARTALTIGKQLKSIADAIIIRQAPLTKVARANTKIKSAARLERSFPRSTLNVFDIAQRMLARIRHEILERAFNKAGCRTRTLYGRDENSLQEFGNTWFSTGRIPEKISLGNYRSTGATDLFLLIQASQPGMAQKEIAALELSKKLAVNDRLIMVVQDMEEIINGGSLPCLMESISAIGKAADIPNQIYYFLHHANPLLALASLELQMQFKGHVQRDEAAILSALEKKFGFLYAPVRDIIPKIIRQKHE